jgi:putative ABC transport system permease protein
MLKLSLRDLRAHLGRYALTFVAVAIGVTFVAGVNTVTDTLTRTFDELFATMNAGTDVWVRGRAMFEVEGQDERPWIDATLAETVAAVPGVAAAEPYVQGFARPLDADGEAVDNGELGPPTFGASWRTVDALNPFTLLDGSRAPETADEVVVDQGLADDLGARVGDPLQVEVDDGVVGTTIVGIARFGSGDVPGGASYVMFDQARAEELLAEPGRVDGIGVVGDDGVGQAELRDRVAAVLREGGVPMEVVTGAALTAEQQDNLADYFRFFRLLLRFFAGLAVVVGAFVIFTSFSFIVTQRQRQVALLRAVGASRRQVLGSVLLESLMIGVVASIVGCLAGTGLAAGLSRLMMRDSGGLVLRPASLMIAVAVGVVVTVLSATVPAWRATQVPPVAALFGLSVDTSHRSRGRLALGVLLLAAGAASLAVMQATDAGMPAGGAGIAAICLGLVVLGPIAAVPGTAMLGAVLPAARGVVGRLAQQNAARNPKRTASTASALMICMGAVTLVLVVVASVRASIDEIVDQRFLGDFVISGDTGGRGLPPELVDQVNTLPEVDAAAGVRFGPAEIDGAGHVVAGVDPAQAFELYDIGVSAGDITQLGEGTIAVYEQAAEDNGWSVGDVLDVRFVETGPTTLRIVALTETKELFESFIVSTDVFDANMPETGDVQVLVRLADGVTPADGQTALEAVAEQYPSVEVQDLTAFKDDAKARLDPLMVGVLVLLTLTVVVAVIGVVNTLVLAVVERTREIGLTRAVGATRGQIRATIRWEAVLIAAFGVVAALAVGVVFGWVIVQALRSEGFTAFAVPVGQLVLVAIATAVLSLAAAVVPAAWAGRRPILAAIANE